MASWEKCFKNLSRESKSLFSLLQKKGPLTKNELILIADMKLTSLNRALRPLEEQKMIVEVGIGESTGGRKPLLYDVNPDIFYVIGIDISRIYTRVVITNSKMDIILEEEFLMTKSFTPVKTIEVISEVLLKAIKKLAISKADIIGVGVGTIGPIDRDNRTMYSPRYFSAPSWVNIPLGELLEQEIGLPVLIDNGANTAILAELLFGCGSGFKNIAYFNCGIGIRTGAVSAGNIVRPINDAEDAFGHMVIDVDGQKCNCGNYGCIETYSSIPAITQAFISASKKGRYSIISKPLEEINYKDICTAAERNDHLSREVITGAADILGVGLANYINLLNPQLIILSGPLVWHSNVFYQECKEVALKKYYLKEENSVVFHRSGYFKYSAIAVGAAVMVMESNLNNKILG
ncbi:ROK family protein [Petroclostridium sp. X23]|uniref:ROK family protein n=1 Tax=Petroclostridium sp. X23 TaxID=3045146 RepID=UPI0024ACEB0A|nr:ROK family protein [Petroclostridium sp. X23]WHH56880.1 ROK family protein [Petroclostridium sp. X23]